MDFVQVAVVGVRQAVEVRVGGARLLVGNLAGKNQPQADAGVGVVERLLGKQHGLGDDEVDAADARGVSGGRRRVDDHEVDADFRVRLGRASRRRSGLGPGVLKL